MLEVLNKKIKDGLEQLGIKKLTEVQLKAFKPIYEGRDVLIISPTGTGKTLAALDRKSTRLNSSHRTVSRMPSSA